MNPPVNSETLERMRTKERDAMHPNDYLYAPQGLDTREQVRRMLDAHNRLRRSEEVWLPDLTWDVALERYAQAKADYLAHFNGGALDHNAGPLNPGWGENLFWCSNPAYYPPDAVQSWYDEKPDYSWSMNRCRPGCMCGHYTQIVWKNTLRVGCAAAFCPNGGGIVLVCNYDPPGNWVGERPY